MSKNKKDLYNYTWGFGIEHEMHIFHKPKRKENGKITDFILYDSDGARNRLIKLIRDKKVKLSQEKINLLLNVPYEPTGRLCNGQWVIKKVPFNMPEFITSAPKCGLGLTLNRDIGGLCREIITQKNDYINLLKKDPITKQQIKKYGELMEYPTGMTSYLKYPENPSSLKYNFKS